MARAVAREEPPPLRFAPAYYLGQAIAIARLDEKAIHRSARDNNSLLYGGVFGVAGLSISFASDLLWVTPPMEGKSLSVFLPLIFALSLAALLFRLIGWAACHLVARRLLHGNGRFVGIARAMLMGSIVSVVSVIPQVGDLVYYIWSLAIMMVVFEEIHGIRKLQAFAIALFLSMIMGIMFIVGIVLLVSDH